MAFLGARGIAWVCVLAWVCIFYGITKLACYTLLARAPNYTLSIASNDVCRESNSCELPSACTTTTR